MLASFALRSQDKHAAAHGLCIVDRRSFLLQIVEYNLPLQIKPIVAVE
jgi:hypothetical protein